MTRISIVTISFNQATFLDECITSVVSQRVPGDEYIVVDPGSTDGSREIIERHRMFIDHAILEPDEGPADGLNKGFARATGDVFAYINADDRLAPGALDFVRSYFDREPQTDILCGAIRIIDRLGNPSLRARTADRFDLARYAAGVCVVGQQGTFFRREAFRAAGGFNTANRITWDGELLVDFAFTGAQFLTTDRVLGDFRIYSDSITGSQKHLAKAQSEHERVVERMRVRQVAVPTPTQARWQRWIYRLNPARQLRYILAR